MIADHSLLRRCRQPASQLASIDLKALRDFHDRLEPQAPLTPLGLAELRPVNPAPDRRRLLAQAQFDSKTARIDITSGPLAGRSFKSPTGVARCVVKHYKEHGVLTRVRWRRAQSAEIKPWGCV